MTQRLLRELDGDCMARLKWLVCRRLGIAPGSWEWLCMTRRQVLRFACHLALDARGGPADGAERETARGFDPERFRELGGAV